MRKLTFDPLEFKKFYNQGLNDKEISSILNCSDSVLFTYRKKNNISSNFIYKCKIEDKLEEIKLLKEEGLGNRKISKILNVPRTSLMYLFRKHNLKNIKPIVKYANLNHFQKSVLIGSLLGDSSISKSFSLNIGHSIKQKEYYKHKVGLFSQNIKFLEYRRDYVDKRTGNTSALFQAYSLRYKDISDLREVFYPNNEKSITEEILENFNDVSLAYLFMDDGNSNENVYTIALCNYSMEDLELFKNFLKTKWDINSSTLWNKSIYIKADSREKFISLVKPHIIPEMLYKIKSPH